MAVLIEVLPVFAVLLIAFVATAVDRKRAGIDEDNEDAGEVFALFVDNKNQLRGRHTAAATPTAAESSACGRAGAAALPEPRPKREHSPFRRLLQASLAHPGVPVRTSV